LAVHHLAAKRLAAKVHQPILFQLAWLLFMSNYGVVAVAAVVQVVLNQVGLEVAAGTHMQP
jgi:hypothetical protein